MFVKRISPRAAAEKRPIESGRVLDSHHKRMKSGRQRETAGPRKGVEYEEIEESGGSGSA